MIRIGQAALHWTPEGALTVYDDGSQWGALPHFTDDYYAVAERLGYGRDVMAYCREHEAAHHIMSEWAFGERSRVLWSLAHAEPVNLQSAVAEEALVMTFQRFLRVGERPIIGDCDWRSLRDRGLAVLG